MNATLRSASLRSSPLLFSASKDSRKSGTEMKLRWIERALKEMQKINETIGQRR